ncbi:unnamed protein product [Prorocentrum cordatum]|uniref:Secreted protein n=1 Tax=Prorocentrum cordatum TaxID=2364126 RepID=A0ABN9UQA6_9DINO|nr:unnamed protein product [Polarella glacialis]
MWSIAWTLSTGAASSGAPGAASQISTSCTPRLLQIRATSVSDCRLRRRSRTSRLSCRASPACSATTGTGSCRRTLTR